MSPRAKEFILFITMNSVNPFVGAYEHRIYTESELADIETQMEAYLAKRDRPSQSDADWRKQKKIAAPLFGLIDHLSTVQGDYEDARHNLSGVKTRAFNLTTEKYPFEPEMLEKATKQFYKEQGRLHRLLIIIGDFRKELHKVCHFPSEPKENS